MVDVAESGLWHRTLVGTVAWGRQAWVAVQTAVEEEQASTMVGMRQQ